MPRKFSSDALCLTYEADELALKRGTRGSAPRTTICLTYKADELALKLGDPDNAVAALYESHLRSR